MVGTNHVYQQVMCDGPTCRRVANPDKSLAADIVHAIDESKRNATTAAAPLPVSPLPTQASIDEHAEATVDAASSKTSGRGKNGSSKSFAQHLSTFGRRATCPVRGVPAWVFCVTWLVNAC